MCTYSVVIELSYDTSVEGFFEPEPVMIEVIDLIDETESGQDPDKFSSTQSSLESPTVSREDIEKMLEDACFEFMKNVDVMMKI
ncbi:hypothetical protein AgCh_022223 [Apium graveolens]